jgi:phage terminase Nu1 subunit (DNA packaging protein)
MVQEIILTFEELFPKKAFLTVEDLRLILDCSPQVIQNWSRRADPAKRPPRLQIGKEVRYPKKALAEWLAREQGVCA